MNANLLAMAQDALGSNFPRIAGQFLGESPGSTQSALSALLPAAIGALAQKGATPDGATGLLSLLGGAHLDSSLMGNIAGLLGGGDAGASELLKTGTSRLVPALFGDKAGALAGALSAISGIRTDSSTKLLALVVPLVLTFLKKLVADRGLNAASLSSLLAGQVPHLQGTLDNRVAGALGYTHAGAFLRGLGGLGGQGGQGGAGAAVTTAAAAATPSAKPDLARWLPWLIGVAALALLWSLLGFKPAPVAAAPAGVPEANIVLLAPLGVEVGAAGSSAEARRVEIMKQ